MEKTTAQGNALSTKRHATVWGSEIFIATDVENAVTFLLSKSRGRVVSQPSDVGHTKLRMGLWYQRR
jgi:hypothetical protein